MIGIGAHVLEDGDGLLVLLHEHDEERGQAELLATRLVSLVLRAPRTINGVAVDQDVSPPHHFEELRQLPIERGKFLFQWHTSPPGAKEARQGAPRAGLAAPPVPVWGAPGRLATEMSSLPEF